MTDFNMDNIDDIINQKAVEFVKDIEDLVWDQDISYMDAILEYSDAHQFEIETVGELVARMPVIREKLTIEAEELNLLPRTSRLELW